MTSRATLKANCGSCIIGHWIAVAIVANCVVAVPACRSAARPLTLANISPPALPESQSAGQANSQVNPQPAQQLSSTASSAEPQLQTETSLVSAVDMLPVAPQAAFPTIDPVALPVADVPQTAGAEQLVETLQDSLAPASSLLSKPVAVSKNEVAIDGVRVGRGLIHVAYFTNGDGFPDAKHAARTESLASERECAMTEVRESGKIAIAVYQDVNGDGTLNVNRFGIPIEPFAFSNDAMGKRGPPSFEEAAIDVGNTASLSKPIRIQLP